MARARSVVISPLAGPFTWLGGMVSGVSSAPPRRAAKSFVLYDIDVREREREFETVRCARGKERGGSIPFESDLDTRCGAL